MKAMMEQSVERGTPFVNQVTPWAIDSIECFMSRLARLDAPGALHRLIIWTMERRQIFRDNKDQNVFLNGSSNWCLKTRLFVTQTCATTFIYSERETWDCQLL